MKRLAAFGLLGIVLAVSVMPSSALASHRVWIYAGVADTPEELAFAVKEASFDKYQVFGSSRTSDPDRAILTLKGNRIYEGKVLNNNHVLFTIKGDRIIPGVDSRVHNAIYTVRGNRVYAGTSTSSDDVLYTFDGGLSRVRMFRGKSTGDRSKVVFTIDGEIDEIKFLLPLLADSR